MKFSSLPKVRYRRQAVASTVLLSLLLAGCGSAKAANGPADRAASSAVEESVAAGPEGARESTVAQQASGRIAGVVFDDLDGDGRADPDEPVRAGVVVRVNVGVLKTEGRTNDDGTFAILPDVSILQVVPDAQIWIEADIVVEGPPSLPASTSTMSFTSPAELGNENVQVAVREPARCDTMCDDTLLPDLAPVEDLGVPDDELYQSSHSGWWVDEVSQPGTTLLRFPSATGNIGRGPLHVISENIDLGNQTTNVWQRLYTATGEFFDRPAGRFVFHPAHNHVHLEAFESYELLDEAGTRVVTSGKVSSCLMDSMHLDTSVLPPIRVVNDLQCGIVEQGINVQRADYYGSGLEDQWIDVTGIDPGNYTVRITADPEDVLVESDETNNVLTFDVVLRQAGSNRTWEEMLAGEGV